MSNFNYTFRCNNIEHLLRLDLGNKRIEIYENPFSRDSSSSPDHSIAFSELNQSNVFTTKFKNALSAEEVSEIQFLAGFYSQAKDAPKGERLFYFNTTCNYSRKKERPNLMAAFLLLAVTVLIAVYFFLPVLSHSEEFDTAKLRQPLFIVFVFLVSSLGLFISYYRKTGTKGFSVLGTEEGIYIYSNGLVTVYKWLQFTGKHTLYAPENGFALELVQLESSKSSYSRTKLNRQLYFIGNKNYDFFLKIILHRIQVSGK